MKPSSAFAALSALASLPSALGHMPVRGANPPKKAASSAPEKVFQTPRELESCTDLVEGWYDSDGEQYNCGWYGSGQNFCELYGDSFSNMGYTANEVCCVCGGGKEQCIDESGWHDSDGEKFHCAWYGQKDNCNSYGDQFANKGKTAQDACCVCGGGSTGGGGGCINIPNWVDSTFGDDCSWYEANEPEGCPNWGTDVGTGQLTANEACCWCASDGGGGGGDGGFTITLMNMGANTAFDQAFQNAKARWEALITNDLLDIPAGFTDDLFDDVFAGSKVDVAVDDVLIGYQIAPIDGPSNILGMAGPTFARDNGDGIPTSTIAGIMIFDSADFENMPAEDAEVIVMHEMGHVLGIGTFWGFKCGTACTSGDHSYTCSKASTEYANLSTGSSLLLENDGGPGTACGHWDESSFSNGASSELMTGFFESHLEQPLSRVTAAALEDLGGYVVDYSAADPYPGMATGANQLSFKVLAPSTTFSLQDRIEHPTLHTLHPPE